MTKIQEIAYLIFKDIKINSRTQQQRTVDLIVLENLIFNATAIRKAYRIKKTKILTTEGRRQAKLISGDFKLIAKSLMKK